MGQSSQLSSLELPTSESSRSFAFLSVSNGADVLGYFGEFPILKLLGSGASSYVFEAIDNQLCRNVVLKIMRPELAKKDDHRKRFLREARAAAAIQSDYTIPIHQVGEVRGLPFLEMPILQGETLQTRLERERILTLPAALEITRQILLGLSEAHALGLVHRDIKPANIWLESSEKREGGFKRIRILDFGLARDQTVNEAVAVTQLGGVIGTPHYMSPEQAEGKAIDHRSDFFSLGILFYAMLSGRLPFTGETMTSVLLAVTSRPHRRVNAVNTSVPAAVADLVDQLLCKDVAARPTSATEIIDIIHQLQDRLEEHSPNDLTASQRISERQTHSKRLRYAEMSRIPDVSTPNNLRWPTAIELPPAVVVASNPPRPEKSRPVWTRCVIGGLVAVILALLPLVVLRPSAAVPPQAPPGIPVGLLFARSGTMKISEQSVELATMLAIEEVNAAGGIEGRLLEPVQVPGIDSEPKSYADAARHLFADRRVSVLFGCWTSASRKSVIPVLREHRSLLFYPVQYEGLEQSEHVVYLGPSANQQLLPALEFLKTKAQAKTLYLVGSDYVYPRSANELLRDELTFRKPSELKILGERYQPLGSKAWGEVIEEILARKPDAVLNTINGSSALSFYEQLRLRERDLGVPRTRILSVSMTENELNLLEPDWITGDFLVGSYFSCLTSDASRRFSEKILKRTEGATQATDMMAAAYSGVHLWAETARRVHSLDPMTISKAVLGQRFDSPTGFFQIDKDNRHAWQPIRIVEVVKSPLEAKAQLRIVDAIQEGVPPAPYPTTSGRTPEQWEQFLLGLYRKWDGEWAAKK